MSRNDAFEYGERDRPGRSGRHPADRLSARPSSPNCALDQPRDVFGGTPKTAGETPALPEAWRTLLAGIPSAVACFCHGFEAALAQENTVAVRGLIYYAVEELDNNRISLQGTAGSEGVAFDRLILAPNTRYQVWLLHAETLRIADATFTTLGAGTSTQIPDFVFHETNPHDSDGEGLPDIGCFFAWGARAPSRAVFRALAERRKASEYDHYSTTIACQSRPARTPVGPREGACAPRIVVTLVVGSMLL